MGTQQRSSYHFRFACELVRNGRIGKLHPLQAAFVENDAQQCGFCTPGFVMAVRAFLNKNPQATEAQIREEFRDPRSPDSDPQPYESIALTLEKDHTADEDEAPVAIECSVELLAKRRELVRTSDEHLRRHQRARRQSVDRTRI